MGEVMEKEMLLERALESFSGAYDIVRDAEVAARRVDALAQLRAINQKYVLSKKHVLWEANAFEHALFLCEGELSADVVNDWFAFLTHEAEAPLAHPDAKYPPEGHMYTYLTLIFLCDGVQDEAVKAIKKAKFTKNYCFSLRGWATARVLAVDIERGRVYTNAAGREMERHFKRLLEAR